jgi:hypothetical protein
MMVGGALDQRAKRGPLDDEPTQEVQLASKLVEGGEELDS